MMVKIFMMLSRERDPETAQALFCAYFGDCCLRAYLGGCCGAATRPDPLG
jgi:hypothetical protein